MLFDFIANIGPFSNEMTVHFFRQILAGVEYLHTQNYAHCDLKPENILFDGDLQTIKLIDFGLCTPIKETIIRVGTKSFKSPQIY